MQTQRVSCLNNGENTRVQHTGHRPQGTNSLADNRGVTERIALHQEMADNSPRVRQALTIDPPVSGDRGTKIVAQMDWALSQIRTSIGVGNSGHHIISKEDWSLVRPWAVTDKTTYAKKFYQKFQSEKALWNIGFNIVTGPQHYTNNPGSGFDPSTEEQTYGSEDELKTGFSTEEADTYGIEKRGLTGLSTSLKEIQDLIDRRKSNDEAFDDSQWQTIWDTLDGLNSQSSLDYDSVNPKDSGEWEPDIVKREPEVEESKFTHDDSKIKVDGTYVKVLDGTLVIDGQSLDLDLPAVKDESDFLKIGENFVTLSGGKMKVGGIPLLSWTESCYRKREGYTLTELAPVGKDSVFEKARKTNCDMGGDADTVETVGPVGLDTLDGDFEDDNIQVTYKINLGHILARHSFQRWAGGTTGKNLFFPIHMKDSGIFNWVKDRLAQVMESKIIPQIRGHKQRGIQEAKEIGVDMEPSTLPDHLLYTLGVSSFAFQGITNGAFTIISAKGTADDAEDESTGALYDANRKLEVTIETMAMEEGAIHVTQKALREYTQR